MRLLALLIILGVMCSACGGSPTQPGGTVRVDLDFNAGAQGWVAGVAQYPISHGRQEPTAEYRTLPAELDGRRRALYIVLGGENTFTFYKGRTTGLRPQTRYRVSFQVELASNTPLNVVGAGGPPGEGTYVKAGASGLEPLVVPDGLLYRMNIDKGNGSVSGTDALSIGNIGISRDLCTLQGSLFSCPWTLKTLSSGESTLHVQTGPDGSLWWLVGTDQVFFGTIELFYTRFTAALTPE